MFVDVEVMNKWSVNRDTLFRNLDGVPFQLFSLREDEMEPVCNELMEVFEKQDMRQRDGWHTHHLSDPNFESNFIHETPLFKQFVLNCLQAHLVKINCPVPYSSDDIIFMSSWFTDTKHLEYAHNHDHCEADVAGAFWLETSGDGTDGKFKMQNPLTLLATTQYTRHLADELHIPAQKGAMILFPGWVSHSVGTNVSGARRISISFNIKLVDRKPNGEKYESKA
jgi:hypothetical protein